MSTKVLTDPGSFIPVKQLSIHVDNRAGRLNEIIELLKNNNIHIIGISILDTTDSSLIRLILNYPEETEKILKSNNLSFVVNEIIVVEINSESDLNKVSKALVQAEINIHYMYSFIARPNGLPVLAISLEDNDLASETLKRHQLKILGQSDIAR